MTDVRGKSRILVIDDDAALSEMLQIVLRQEGFDTVRCATGEVALHEFRQSRPDLVLLDLMLPGRDGVAVCRDIRAESGVPIIMLTAKSDTADVVGGLEAGADDYVAKPFKSKELIARIRTRLRRTNGDAGATFAAATVRAEVRATKPGGIVIAHFNRPDSDTAKGMLRAVDDLLSEGVEFVHI